MEREALKCVLQVPELLGDWFASVQGGTFRQPWYEEVRVAVHGAGGSQGRTGGREWVEAVLAACPDDDLRGLVRELAVEPLVTATEPDARYATSIVAKLLADEAGRQLVELKRELGQLDQAQQADRAAAVLADLMELEAYRRELVRVGMGE